MLANENLLWEGSYLCPESIHRLYRYGNRYGLSVRYEPILSLKWHMAVIKYNSKDGEVFDYEIEDICNMDMSQTEEKVNGFIAQAGEFLSKLEE